MKLNYKQTFCIGLAFMGITAFWQVYDTIIPLILKNTFAVEDTLTGVIMALDNILAIVLLPVFGAWSDKINTPLGKRTPFIIVGTLLSASLMMLIPIADNQQSLLLFVLGLGAVLVSMGLYRSPAVALMPDLTPPPLRSQGNAIVNVMGAVGALYALLMIRILVPSEIRADYTNLFISISFILIITLILLLLTVREKKLSEEIRKEYGELVAEDYETTEEGTLSPAVKKSLSFALMALVCYYMAFNGVTTAFSRYAQEVWGLVGGEFATSLILVAITAFVCYVPFGVLASKIGRKKVIASGFVVMGLSFFIVCLFPAYHPIMNVLLVIGSAGGSAVGVNIFPVIIDMCSEQEVGKYTGLYYTFSMSAQIATPIFSGFLMEHVAYQALFPYAGSFALLGFIAMLFVHHGDVKPEKKFNIFEYMDN